MLDNALENVRTERSLGKILVATDFSESSTALLDRGIQMALGMSAAMDILHVRQPLRYALTGGFATEPQRETVINWIDDALCAQ